MYLNNLVYLLLSQLFGYKSFTSDIRKLMIPFIDLHRTKVAHLNFKKININIPIVKKKKKQGYFKIK